MTEYHKMSQQNAVYVTDDPAGQYFCKTCIMFLPKRSECTMVCGPIAENGGCNLYVHGKAAKLEQTNPYRVGMCDAGYMETGEGFGCRRCRHFVKESKECVRVKGTISPKGCCNYWQRKEKVCRAVMMADMMRED